MTLLNSKHLRDHRLDRPRDLRDHERSSPCDDDAAPQSRRLLLGRSAAMALVAGTGSLLAACGNLNRFPVPSTYAIDAGTTFASLETEAGVRLGVSAIDLRSGARVNWRENERFALCSTFKLLAAAAVLKMSESDASLFRRRIMYTSSALVPYSPITSTRLARGMTVGELCAAALQYSDNTAGNLLLQLLGGPAGVTSFARFLGDEQTRLDRWETELNSAIPGDPRDTTTPSAMAGNLQNLVVGQMLGQEQRFILQRWITRNTTGAARIRAGVPRTWDVGDKTGTGDYGSTNDIAMLFPPARPPIALAVYLVGAERDARPRDDVVAEATRLVVRTLS